MLKQTATAHHPLIGFNGFQVEPYLLELVSDLFKMSRYCEMSAEFLYSKASLIPQIELVD